MANPSRQLPTGRCNFQDLTLKTSDFNTKCQCQAFWLDDSPIAVPVEDPHPHPHPHPLSSSSSLSLSSGERFGVVTLHRDSRDLDQSSANANTNTSRRYQQHAAPRSNFCVCQHHACFHEKQEDNDKGKQAAISFNIPIQRSVSSSATSKASSSNKDPALSTTFDDHANANLDPNDPNHTRRSILTEGLGLSISTTRDEPFETPCAHHHGPSVASSAVTELASHMWPSPGRVVPQQHDRQPLQYYYPNIPQMPSPRPPQHAQLQRLTPHVRQEGSFYAPSTIADSPLYMHPGFQSLSQQAIGVVGALNSISMSLLPAHLQRHNDSNVTTADFPVRFIGLGDDPFVGEEVTRTAMAAEGAARALLQCLQQRGSQVGGGYVTSMRGGSESSNEPERQNRHMRPPTVKHTTQSRSPSRKTRSPSPAVSNTSKQSVFSSIPPPQREVSNLKSQLQTLVEKFGGLEDAMEDTVNKAELAEDRVHEMEGRMINIEDKVDGVAESFSRHKDESATRKRYNDDPDDDDDDGEYDAQKDRESSKRKKKKRRKHRVSDDVNFPKLHQKIVSSMPTVVPGTTVKTTTRTLTSFTKSTSTSFASNSSNDSSSAIAEKTQSLLATVLVQLSSLSDRIAALEFASPPTSTRPWTVQVVVLPPTTWATWRKKDNVLRLNTQTPRVPPAGGKAWRRLYSRGLIRCIDVMGGESRDIERAIRKCFGAVFKSLYEELKDDADNDEGDWEWSPLRKAPRQTSLRFLDVSEMDKGFWKADFLRGTCAATITTPQPPTASDPATPLPPSSILEKTQAARQEPTHRLWITNCWTGGMSNGSGRDTALDGTQQSSLGPSSDFHRRVREASISSTQRGAAGRRGIRRTRSSGLETGDESTPDSAPFVFGLHDRGNFGGGWKCVQALPAKSATDATRNKNNSLQVKTTTTADDVDTWKYDEGLDGPLPSSQDALRASQLSESSDDQGSSDELVRTRVGTPERPSAHIEELSPEMANPDDIDHLNESFASQASFYGFEDTPMKATPEQPPQEEEPSHTLDVDPAATPRVAPYTLHPLRLQQRLEDLQTQQTAYETETTNYTAYTGHDCVSEAEEERRRGSRSPTVEDDLPPSVYSHGLSSYHTGTAGYTHPSCQSGNSYGMVQQVYSPSDENARDTYGWAKAAVPHIPKSFRESDEQ